MRRNVKEQTAEQVLAAFQVPKASIGSCISYDTSENVVRQVTKFRNGEFREHSVLVGMRFVVL